MIEAIVQYYVLPVLIFAVVLAFIRLVKGPSLPDRVVALDLMNTLGIGIVAVYAIAFNEGSMIDVAITLGLISFLGTIAFAYYMEKRTL
ncbi:MAG TPA: cation:proton antiporter [Anaerolineae bacterium]|nr:cation:proton antiporter [Anaerolineae bacterium]HMR64770.1 cation:proton antiporter [Anaerolineae bacterium]